ncbi:MAG: NF038143 family protein, partial [Deltaproteobacteria bacterium]|nr:NF038143 family protein [Deltaproteobacteria bacterium]
MGDRYDLILAAESGFARRAALGVIVRRPVKPLLQLIPGMFIFDFLRRTSAIRKFSRFYLPPRRAALDAARDIENGLSREEAVEDAEEKARTWLDSHGLSGEEVRRTLIDLVHEMIEHYVRLLQAGGESYPDLVRTGYGSRGAYRSFLARLANLERA